MSDKEWLRRWADHRSVKALGEDKVKKTLTAESEPDPNDPESVIVTSTYLDAFGVKRKAVRNVRREDLAGEIELLKGGILK